MYVWTETMRILIYRVQERSRRLPEAKQADAGLIHAQSAASVLYAAETMAKVVAEGVQIHGGGGYIWESEMYNRPVSRHRSCSRSAPAPVRNGPTSDRRPGAARRAPDL